ncbi:hypothetical protein ACGFWD_20790 [Streptomyces sp. NPDC048448]|uniref:hypothetical protein n=1 Tax=Streptomyces sp. NPDC048448 TaxID=3365554 RepID=UPI003721B254
MTTVHDLVAAQAERVPTATAVIAGERRTSYKELTALAARFAQGLAEPAATREIFDALGVDFSIRTVFELPVPVDLATVVEQRALAAPATEEGVAP